MPTDLEGTTMFNSSFRLPVALAVMIAACMAVLASASSAQADGGSQTDAGVRATAQEQIAVGGFHSCAIEAGDVFCWGEGSDGALGYGNQDDIGDDEAAGAGGPVDIGGKAVAVTAGWKHTCALRSDGRVLCWGEGLTGKLGYGNTTSIGDDETPESVGTVTIGRLAVAITAGDKHTCALLNNGAIRCWGYGFEGALGYANTLSIGDNELPSSVPGVKLGPDNEGEAVAVAAGGGHTCAVLADGDVRCWGRNSSGQLGLGNMGPNIGSVLHPWNSGAFPPEAVDLPGVRNNAIGITAGANHTCAMIEDGRVSCWGEGSSGQLGYGNTADVGDDELPSTVAALTFLPRATSISAGGAHTCAVLADGETRCWGNGGSGRLGLASTSGVLDAVAASPVSVGNETTAIGAGVAHTCARLADGEIRCWGTAADGRLGYGNTNNIGDDEDPSSVGPVDLGVAPYPTSVATGDEHSCALISNGEVRCWGRGDEGQLGYGNTANIGDDEDPSTAGAVQLGNEAKAITAGAQHTCAIMADGGIRCWGLGVYGRLGYSNIDTIGDNETPGSIDPVQVGQLAVGIGAGDTHTCALVVTGAVRCWGQATNGRLGNPNSTDNIGNDEHPSTALDLNFGGTGQSEFPGLPKALAVGDQHACAILSDGSLRCWGKGADGRLGYANTSDVGDDETPGALPNGEAHPVNIGSAKLATRVAAGSAHTCVRMEDGAVRCWGSGVNGRLGYDSTDMIGNNEHPASAGPVQLGSGRYGTMLSAAGAHTCTAMDDGHVRCWGYGASGRLGYKSTASIGDNEHPSAAGPIDFGSGRKVHAMSSGDAHTCAVLADATVRCWGYGSEGQLGYGNTSAVGDNETPASVGPVDIL